jgi:hypothetical protein
LVADDPSVEIDVDVETEPAGVPAETAAVPVIPVLALVIFVPEP